MYYKLYISISVFFLIFISLNCEELDYKMELRVSNEVKKSVFPKKDIKDFALLKNSQTEIKIKQNKSINPYKQYFNDLADDSMGVYYEVEGSINSYEIVMERVFNTIINPGSLEFDSQWQKSQLKITLNNKLIPQNIKVDFDYKWTRDELKLNLDYDVDPENFKINFNYNFITNQSEAALTLFLF